ncbi:MAG: hypothetical protein M1481_01715 [Candidatus Thermoplasmatota archaeon]|jgi:hypothetical protein|nr:hypothetical protein [Candidatus Thermoplasmatota archaeon]MCL5962879.1 hypothetical protein [Candidatus Thermoplasmatota archaeon]
MVHRNAPVMDKKDKKCDVKDCENEAVRSFSMSNVKDIFSNFKDGNVKHVNLCKEHYKVYHKKTKEDRKLDHLRWAH